MAIQPQLPGIWYGALPKGYGPALIGAPLWVVVHDTGNTASANDESHYAVTRTDPESDWTSAHFYVDQNEIIGSVPLHSQAWAAFGNANAHSWQIEMCGYDAGEPGAVPIATIVRTASLVRTLCILASIPMVHIGAAGIAAGQRGIVGHLDFTQEEHRTGGHTDPGYRFDWATFITQVIGGTDVELTDSITLLNGDGKGNLIPGPTVQVQRALALTQYQAGEASQMAEQWQQAGGVPGLATTVAHAVANLLPGPGTADLSKLSDEQLTALGVGIGRGLRGTQ